LINAFEGGEHNKLGYYIHFKAVYDVNGTSTADELPRGNIDLIIWSTISFTYSFSLIFCTYIYQNTPWTQQQLKL
jgi:hypothetical protein